jgi:hypothetical protein
MQRSQLLETTYKLREENMRLEDWETFERGKWRGKCQIMDRAGCSPSSPFHTHMDLFKTGWPTVREQQDRRTIQPRVTVKTTRETVRI